MLNIRATGISNFLSFNAKKTFNNLWLEFIKASILWHFDLKSHIQIQFNVSGYDIDAILSHLNLNSYASLNQWHIIAYFFRKMIFVSVIGCFYFVFIAIFADV